MYAELLGYTDGDATKNPDHLINDRSLYNNKSLPFTVRRKDDISERLEY